MTVKTLPVIAYDRDRHEPALKRFTEKVLGAEVCARRQRIIDTYHERMPGRERTPLRHVLMDGDIVAGTLGHMPVDFLVGGRRMAARYTHDLLVDPEYRGGGLGKVIVGYARELGDFYPGGMWMTGACHKIHQTCGFDDVAELLTYTAVLDPGSFTSRRNFSPLKAAVGRAGLGVKRMQALARARKNLAGAHNTLAVMERMDPALDPVWLELAKSYDVTRVRDAAYINWKYADHPALDYQLLVATRNGTATGYLIWRAAPDGHAEQRAVIVDFLVARNDARTLEELVSRVLLDASAAGIDAVAIISTQSFVVDALQKLGFVAGSSRNAWVIANWKDVMPAAWVKDLERWHMCMGDSDGDQWTGSM
jgi:GNAT superfamily N-acetyltransferase